MLFFLSGQWSNMVKWVERQHMQVLFSNSRLASIPLPCCELMYSNIFLVAINTVTVATPITIGITFPSFSHANKNLFFWKRSPSFLHVWQWQLLMIFLFYSPWGMIIIPVLLCQHDKHPDLLNKRHFCDYLWPCPRVLCFASLRERGNTCVSSYMSWRGELLPYFLTSRTTEPFNMKIISDLWGIST